MRTINKIIIHSTATPAGRVTTLADVEHWHTERGFSGIGYHFLIGLDGERWTGRNLAVAGAHAVGHNANSIGIAYVGGTNTSGQPTDTRTEVQKAELTKLISELKKQFPNAEVIGHRDVGSTACPSFDAKKEYSV